MVMKFLIVIGIIAYIIYKVGGLFFRAGAASQQGRAQYRNPESNSTHQSQQSKKEKRNGGIKGGDYVDYEEVK
jgi:hypothetical protein